MKRHRSLKPLLQRVQNRLLRGVREGYLPAEPSGMLSWLAGYTSGAPFRMIVADGHAWLELENGIQLLHTNRFNSVADTLLRLKEFESAEFELLGRHLPPGGVFFDIGANSGLYSLVAAKVLHAREVHAFEPIPETAEEFEQNWNRNAPVALVILNRLALCESDGEVRITANLHASNYLTSTASKVQAIQVPSQRLDSYVSSRKPDRIDFIKIDVEGQEHRVLQGSLETLKHFRPALLVEIMETPSEFYDRKCGSASETLSLLTDLGYQCSLIDDVGNLYSVKELGKAVLKRSYHNYLCTMADPA